MCWLYEYLNFISKFGTQDSGLLPSSPWPWATMTVYEYSFVDIMSIVTQTIFSVVGLQLLCMHQHPPCSTVYILANHIRKLQASVFPDTWEMSLIAKLIILRIAFNQSAQVNPSNIYSFVVWIIVENWLSMKIFKKQKLCWGLEG